MSSTKTDTAIIRTPQAISVVGRQQTDHQKPASLAEATRYAPGVRSETFGADPRNDWFLIRGFTARESGYFLDGLQLFTSAFATWTLEPFGLERLKILRGPNSGLYGGASPGGIISAVSKRPPPSCRSATSRPASTITAMPYAGFDIGGPVDAPGTEGKLFYRLVGLGRAGGTQVDYVNNDHFSSRPQSLGSRTPTPRSPSSPRCSATAPAPRTSCPARVRSRRRPSASSRRAASPAIRRPTD